MAAREKTPTPSCDHRAGQRAMLHSSLLPDHISAREQAWCPGFVPMTPMWKRMSWGCSLSSINCSTKVLTSLSQVCDTTVHICHCPCLFRYIHSLRGLVENLATFSKLFVFSRCIPALPLQLLFLSKTTEMLLSSTTTPSPQQPLPSLGH